MSDPVETLIEQGICAAEEKHYISAALLFAKAIRAVRLEARAPIQVHRIEAFREIREHVYAMMRDKKHDYKTLGGVNERIDKAINEAGG